MQLKVTQENTTDTRVNMPAGEKQLHVTDAWRWRCTPDWSPSCGVEVTSCRHWSRTAEHVERDFRTTPRRLMQLCSAPSSEW